MAPNFKPLGDRVLVKPEQTEENVGGIIVPGGQKSNYAEVVSVGPGYVSNNGERIPPPLEVGDVIIMPQYGGVEVNYDGQSFVLLNVGDISAVVEG